MCARHAANPDRDAAPGALHRASIASASVGTEPGELSGSYQLASGEKLCTRGMICHSPVASMRTAGRQRLNAGDRRFDGSGRRALPSQSG
jgi:hypothetical protein